MSHFDGLFAHYDRLVLFDTETPVFPLTGMRSSSFPRWCWSARAVKRL